MAILKFEPPKERAYPRVKIARDVHERAECYRAYCGALELADLVKRAQVYVMDKDADFREQEKEGTTIPAKGAQRRSVKRVSPAEKPAGPLNFFVTPDALPRRAEKCNYDKSIERTHPILSGEHAP